MIAEATRTIETVALDAPRMPATETAGLGDVAHKLARGFQQTFSAFGGEVRLVPGELRRDRHEAWRAQVLQFAWVRFGLPELGTSATLTFPFDFIVAAIDRYYGGQGECGRDARELTPAELRCLRSLGATLADDVGAAWSEVASFNPVFEGVGHAVPAPLAKQFDETLAVQDFVLTDSAGGSWPMAFAVPQKPLERLPTARDDASPRGGVSPVWAGNLQDAVMDVRFPVRTVLSRPDLSLDLLLTLAPGDVIPVLLPALVPVSVGGRVIGHGTVGEENGRAAIRLERMEGNFGR